MRAEILSVLSLFTAAPFLAIAAILVLYLVRQVRWVRRTWVGRLFGVQPSAVGLGMAFLFLQAFWRPCMVHTIEVCQEADLDEDDEGDPETPAKELNRQLKRIRRGERVERLVLRL
jgi:energy-coupling factor transporter transmembrane protein EcfT